MLIVLISCYSQTPQLIVSGADTFGVVPSALERNINRTYNAAHKYKDLSELCQQENDSLREALSEKSGALKDCDQKNKTLEIIDSKKDEAISGLKRELKNKNFWSKVKDAYIYVITPVAIGVGTYLYFRR